MIWAFRGFLIFIAAFWVVLIGLGAAQMRRDPSTRDWRLLGWFSLHRAQVIVPATLVLVYTFWHESLLLLVGIAVVVGAWLAGRVLAGSVDVSDES
jgi:hypothetical protein